MSRNPFLLEEHKHKTMDAIILNNVPIEYFDINQYSSAERVVFAFGVASYNPHYDPSKLYSCTLSTLADFAYCSVLKKNLGYKDTTRPYITSTDLDEATAEFSDLFIRAMHGDIVMIERHNQSVVALVSLETAQIALNAMRCTSYQLRPKARLAGNKTTVASP